MEEVANGTGAYRRRYADAIAMNLFPSRGMSIHGVEIKVSIGDLKKEIQQPEKAEEIARYCDFWYLAIPKGLADNVHLPMGWGVLELNGSGSLIEKIKPTKMEAAPLDRTFVAALARRINQLDEATINATVQDRMRPYREKAEKECEEMMAARDKFRSYQNRAEKYDELIATLNALKEKTGVDILEGFSGHEDFLKAAYLVKKIGLAETWGGIIGLQRNIHEFIGTIDKTINRLTQKESQT